MTRAGTVPRAMGIDFGTRRIGIALADELALTAQPLCTLERRGLVADMEALAELARSHGVERIVIGLPRNMDGTTGRAAREVLAFGRSLEMKAKIPVITFDERLSSVQAHRVLRDEMGLSERRRREVVDQVAAVVILQTYLDWKRSSGTEGGPS